MGKSGEVMQGLLIESLMTAFVEPYVCKQNSQNKTTTDTGAYRAAMG